MANEIAASRVRYLKLGDKARWAQACLADNTLRIGFWTREYFDLCVRGDWKAFAEALRDEGRGASTVTRFVGEVRAVYEDDGSILWLTFENQRLYWTRIDSKVPPWKSKRGEEGTLRRVTGWRSTDLRGNELLMTGLSGELTKTQAYRGTSCDIANPKYVIDRINGRQKPEVQEAVRLSEELKASVVKLIRMLGWRDLELLVDLVFTQSGWRRTSVSGKTQKSIDMEVILPTTRERAVIQVKSRTSKAEFDQYVADAEHLQYDKTFFVYHTCADTLRSEGEDVIIWDAEVLAAHVLEAGLLYWLTQKVA
jgi:hypothetical protein